MLCVIPERNSRTLSFVFFNFLFSLFLFYFLVYIYGYPYILYSCLLFCFVSLPTHPQPSSKSCSTHTICYLVAVAATTSVIFADDLFFSGTFDNVSTCATTDFAKAFVFSEISYPPSNTLQILP